MLGFDTTNIGNHFLLVNKKNAKKAKKSKKSVHLVKIHYIIGNKKYCRIARGFGK